MPLVVLLFALFASCFPLGKVALGYTSPLFLTAARMTLAGLVLLAYQGISNPKAFKFKKSMIMPLVWLSLFNIFLCNAFEFWGLQYLPSVKVCFIYSLSPFLAALFSYFLFKERLSKKKWISLAFGFIGMVPIFMSQTSDEVGLGHMFFFSWAELSLVIATSCAVLGWIFLKKVTDEEGLSLPIANGISMLAGGLLAFPMSFLLESWTPSPVSDFWPLMGWMALMILVSNIICYNLYGHLLGRFTATFMSFAGFITPFFASLYGWFFLGEAITWHYYVAGLIVYTSLYFFYQEELKSGVRVDPMTVT